MKTAFTVLALAALWWLQQQIAISRQEEKTTLDRLKKIIDPEKAA